MGTFPAADQRVSAVGAHYTPRHIGGVHAMIGYGDDPFVPAEFGAGTGHGPIRPMVVWPHSSSITHT